MEYIGIGYVAMALIVAAWVYHEGDQQSFIDELYENKVLDSTPSDYHRAIFYGALTLCAVVIGALWPITLPRKLIRKIKG